MNRMYTREQVVEKSTEYFNGDTLAANVFADKYALKSETGEFVELTPDDMHRRLAKEFARIESKYPNSISEQDIYESMKEFKYIVPQGSPMAGIGNDTQIMSVSNCFVIGSPEDSYGGIMKADEEIAQLSKRRAGIGLDISNIRPKGQKTKNAANTTDGISVFMDRFSNTCREVAQGGRRGAEMQSISVHHPEVETFIKIKKDKKRVTGANISVKLTEEFMVAVKNNTDYEQRWPVDSKTPKISRKVDAKKIWDMIIESAWESAEPGILFWDNIEKNTPSEAYDDCKAVSVNPCFSIDQRVLTNDGYVKFSDLLKSDTKDIIIDNRISYIGDNNNEKWEIDNTKNGTSIVNGYNFRMTSPSEKLYKILFKNGQELKVTADHHIATSIGMVMAKDLTPEHNILIADCQNDLSIQNREPETIDEICSFLMGLIAGDGTFQIKSGNQIACIDVWGDDRFRILELVKKYIDILYDNEYASLADLIHNNWKNRGLSKYYVINATKQNKIRIESRFLAILLNHKYAFNKETKQTVPEFIINNSRKSPALFYCSGLFYADASIQGSGKSGYTVRLHQSNEKLLQEVQLILHSNGISSSIYKRRDAYTKEIKGKMCNIKTQYELITTNTSYKHFTKIGFFNHPEKTKKLDELVALGRASKTNNYTKMVSFEFIGEEPVYCLSEDVSKSCIVNTISTRRCGEIILPKYDSCRLICMNVLNFVDNPYEENSTFNYDKFIKYCKIAQRMMDDLVDIELEQIDKILNKIESDPESDEVKYTEVNMWNKIKQTCKNGRRTGLGVTAIGDTLAALGIQYGSLQSIDMVENIYKTMALAAYESSIDMAEDRGSFPRFDRSVEFDNAFIQRIYNELSEEYKQKYDKFGRRNIALTTTSPTGSVSIVTRTSSGIEPVFLLSYDRRKKINPSENVEPDYIDSVGDKWKTYKIYHHELKKWMDITGKTEISDSPWFGATSQEIDWERSVELQAAAQKWVCHSISKTCNLPSTATKEIVANVYMKAWETGCKGFTVYRDGCRDGVLITNDKKDVKEEAGIIETNSPKRPDKLACDIHHVKIKGENWIVLIGLLKDKPFEVFAGLSKFVSIPKKITNGLLVKRTDKKDNGSAYYDLVYGDETDPTIIKDVVHTFENSTNGSFTRMLSFSLRHGGPIQHLVHQLSKDEHSDLYSFSRVVARVLKSYVKDGTKIKAKCPNCGGEHLIYQEGCLSCQDCSYSKC